jgi:cellobiose phosphorylase
MYIAGIKYILGLNILDGYLSFNPHIPNSWKEYEIKYRYGNSVYNIRFINLNGKNSSIEKVMLNGELIENSKIKLVDDGGIYDVEVYL